MSISQAEKEFVSYIVELMQPIGAVHAKGMFGGHGIYLDGLMFGLVAESTLYFKVDSETKPEFESRGLEAFTYKKKDKEFTMSYFQCPEEALDNQEEMSSWARMAHGVALRAAARKRVK